MKNTELDFAKECIEECQSLYFEDKFEEAVLVALRAKAVSEEAGAYADICHAVNMLGIIYDTIGDTNRSLDYYLAGIDIALEHQFIDELALFYNNLGSEYLDLKDYTHALKLFLDAYEIIRDHTVPACHEHVLYINLCNTYYALEDYEKASEYLEYARKLNPEMEDYDKLSFAITECRLEIRLGHEAHANELLPETMSLALNSIAGLGYWADMNELALILMELKKKDEAHRMVRWLENDVKERYGNELSARIRVLELQLDFCEAFDEQETYRDLCVKMNSLRKAGKDADNRRRAANIDLRIELHNKERQWLKAEKKSSFDALTGVRNRYSLKDDGQAAIEKCLESRKAITVGILDLDFFKQVNDTYGHIRGDQYLQAVADAARQALPEGGNIYRYGGDEFVVLLESDRAEVAEAFAAQMSEILSKQALENKASEVSQYLTLSQGYCILVPRRGNNIWDLVEAADAVLYQVKQGGKNSYKVLQR